MKVWAFLSSLLLCGCAAFADEIHLKDGSKIVGTVIGFQENTYQVQTSFGTVSFPKNMIASIIPSGTAPAAAPAPASKPEPKVEPKAEPKKEILGQVKPVETKPVDVQPVEKKPAPAKKPAEEKRVAIQPVRAASNSAVGLPNSSSVMPVAPSANRSAKSDVATASDAPPGDVPPEPEAPAIREEVQGNHYINYTHGFRMYKAPSWNLIDDDTRKTLPNAIVALGASDDSTLMVVGLERTKQSVESRAAATEKRLHEIYENYRRTSEQKTRVAGFPAIEQRYRGAADGREWSGIVVTLARGSEVYTLLGMTSADSDLIQIQENVISRAISSLEFTQK